MISASDPKIGHHLGSVSDEVEVRVPSDLFGVLLLGAWIWKSFYRSYCRMVPALRLCATSTAEYVLTTQGTSTQIPQTCTTWGLYGGGCYSCQWLAAGLEEEWSTDFAQKFPGGPTTKISPKRPVVAFLDKDFDDLKSQWCKEISSFQLTRWFQ